jgi:hypothetical protein
MDPSPLLFAVDFGPDMVFTVPDPSHSGPRSTTQHAEAVGELSSPTSLGLEQGPDICIARKPLKGRTALVCTPV